MSEILRYHPLPAPPAELYPVLLSKAAGLELKHASRSSVQKVARWAIILAWVDILLRMIRSAQDTTPGPALLTPASICLRVSSSQAAFTGDLRSVGLEEALIRTLSIILNRIQTLTTCAP